MATDEEDVLVAELVTLARDPLTQLLGGANAQWDDLIDKLAPSLQAVEREWGKAGREAAEHIALVMQNNPRETLGQLLKRRADLRQVLKTPFDRATRLTEDRVRMAWDRGRAQGMRDGNAELRRFGLGSSDEVTIDTDVRDKLLGDVRVNGQASRDRLLSAVTSDDPAAVRRSLEQAAVGQGSRARLSVYTAGTHAWSEAKEATLAEHAPAGARKVWVCSFINSCGTCVKLHGTRRKLGEPFPAGLSYTKAPGVYAGALNHPPRHPQCRCRIILWVPQVGDTSSMLTRAEEFWRGVREALRRKRR